MSAKEIRSLCILGRQPALGLAELESLYGAAAIRPVGQVAAEISLDTVSIDFPRLGGTVKLARVLDYLPHDWPNIEKYLMTQVPKQLQHVPPGKFTLGLSIYGMEITAKTIGATLMKLKKMTKEKSNRSIRIIPNRSPALNSAQVLHNKLTSLGAWELLLVRDGEQTILAQTMFVQDITAYGQRDQARPKRDARVGMLPPKLAQIIINLANPQPTTTVLDPFCGTGVILQEALLMGYDVVGTDLDERMTNFSQANIDWLRAMRPQLNNQVLIATGDATSYTWPSSIGVVASETYLGRPLTGTPDAASLDKIVNDVNTILQKFLTNLSAQLRLGATVSLALPAWRKGDRFVQLPLIDHLDRLGYNRLAFQHAASDNLIYWRPGQIVGRQLIVLQKL